MIIFHMIGYPISAHPVVTIGYPVTTVKLNTPAPPLPFDFFSSYLPCWRDRDQKGGFLLSDLCIAHRGSLGGQVIFGYLAGTIFDGLLSLFKLLFINFHCFMQWFGEELLASLLCIIRVGGIILYRGPSSDSL